MGNNLGYEEAFRNFRNLEHRFDLFAQKIQGVHVWDHLRFKIWNEILNETGLMENAPRRHYAFVGFISRITEFINLIWNSIFMNPFTFGEREFLFIGAGLSRKKKLRNGRLEDMWCDPLVDHIGRDRSVLLEEPFLGRHGLFNHTEHIVTTSWIKLSYGCAYLFKRFSSQGLTLEESSFLEEVDSFISKTFKISSLSLKKRVLDLLYKHRAVHPKIIKLFKSVRPKAIFMVCSYAGREIYIEAAQALSIPVIELQHGSITPYHVGYSYDRGSFKCLSPDYFLSFGRFWEETVKLPVKNQNVMTMGFPYLDREFAMTKKTKKKQIVFISQWTIGKKLSEFAVKLNQNLPPGWNLIFKLHPREAKDWKKHYSELAVSNINVLSGDSCSLYELLGESAIQIGVYSTALYEGLALGCRTYLVELSGYRYMEPLVEKGLCELVKDPSEISFQVGSGDTSVNKDYFFADNWQLNLNKALKQWLK